MEPEMQAGRIHGDPINAGPQGITKDAETIASRLKGFKLYPKFFDARSAAVLVTSDRPVGLFAMAEWDHGHWMQPSPVDSSLPDCWAKDAVGVFPISSECAVLACRGATNVLEDFLKKLNLVSDPDVGAWINAMTAFWANHVYSASRDAKFLRPGPSVVLVGIEEFVIASEAFTAANTVRWPRKL
jgi:hypothetical protein